MNKVLQGDHTPCRLIMNEKREGLVSPLSVIIVTQDCPVHWPSPVIVIVSIGELLSVQCGYRLQREREMMLKLLLLLQMYHSGEKLCFVLIFESLTTFMLCCSSE